MAGAANTVAIVIPTRDRPHFLGDAIASAIATAAATDRHAGCTILVVDNSSTDELAEAARAIANHHGVEFLQSSPAGVSRARNVGMRATDADLISFLDDDDAYDPGFLDVTLGLFAAHPESAVVFGLPIICDENLQPFYHPPPGPLPCGEAFVFSTGDIVSWGASLAKRSVLLDIGGFDESIAMSEDWDLQMRVAANHDYVGSPEVVQHIRVHDRGVMTHANWWAYLRECAIVERRGFELSGREGRQYLRRRRALLKLRGQDVSDSIQHAKSASERKEKLEAVKFLVTAVRRSPLHAAKAAVTALLHRP